MHESHTDDGHQDHDDDAEKGLASQPREAVSAGVRIERRICAFRCEAEWLGFGIALEQAGDVCGVVGRVWYVLRTIQYAVAVRRGGQEERLPDWPVPAHG